MKKRTFAVYADPAHAWIKVPKAFLVRIIGSDWRRHFTCFSYERGDSVYLEEDQDATTLIIACRCAGVDPVWRHSCSNRPSRIRSYAPLSPI
jgi:hypothetical protein